MPNWLPTFNSLKISKLFVSAPLRKRCCYEVKKELKISEATARSALRVMQHNNWLESEKEHVNQVLSTRPPRVLYRITDHGLRAATECLKAVQWQGTIILSS
jgi:DNA-binding PadR family transcriptional regulator